MGMRRVGLVAIAAAIAVLAVGRGGSVSAKASVAATRHTTPATVTTRKVKKLGTILVNSKGLTLYMFVRDHQKKVTCTSKTCVLFWPPLKVKKGQKPTAGGAAKKKLLGTDGRVVTYNRWPLYTYYLDHKPGQTLGQNVNNSGGKWYVLSPSGKVVKTP